MQLAAVICTRVYIVAACYIYSSSVFRNTSGGGGVSKHMQQQRTFCRHSSYFIGRGKAPPTEIWGGGQSPPLSPLCCRPCTYCTLIGTNSQSPHRGLDCTSQCVWYVHYIMTHDSGHFNDVCSWMDLHYTWHIPKAGSSST